MTPDGFLARMAAGSRRRLAEARSRISDDAMRKQARFTPTPLPLEVPAFGLIAEVKLRAPSAGALQTTDDPVGTAVRQARTYQAAGATAISVLTEPDAFDGSLDNLRAVAAAIELPVMRKDFLVDPYQVWEARACGASGVLLIVRMLDDATLAHLMETTEQAGLFALVECFDTDDLARVAAYPARYEGVLVGINTRDLATLGLRPERLQHIDRIPPGAIPVAESGMATPADTRAARDLGYRLALVGTALMQAPDPAALAREMIGS